MKAHTPAWHVASSFLLATLVVPAVHGRVVGRLQALNQATVRIEVTGGPIIYIDPTGITTNSADADFILLTHNHGDHQSVPVIERLRKPGTVIVSSPPGVPALQQGLADSTIIPVTPGARFSLGNVEVETVPMYNVVKNNHPRAMNFVGYVVNVGGVRVYHAGDTERIPEMRIFSADVAMLPLGQRFTMNTVQEAVDAALDLKARIAIPIHWGNAEGTREDAEFFVNQLASRMQTMVNTPAQGFALELSETVAIAQHPASRTVAPGGSATLAVQATGSGALRYQWRRNGLAIPGATLATLPLSAVASTNAGDYDVIISDVNGPLITRMARVVVDTPRSGQLVNLSVRGVAGSGDDALTAGFVISGNMPRRLLIRAVGPGLAAFGVERPMTDPKLEVFMNEAGRSALFASNDNWAECGVEVVRAAAASAGAFALTDPASKDAAMIVTLPAGTYTAQVTAADNARGAALVEVYELPEN